MNSCKRFWNSWDIPWVRY